MITGHSARLARSPSRSRCLAGAFVPDSLLPSCQSNLNRSPKARLRRRSTSSMAHVAPSPRMAASPGRGTAGQVRCPVWRASPERIAGAGTACSDVASGQAGVPSARRIDVEATVEEPWLRYGWRTTSAMTRNRCGESASVVILLWAGAGWAPARFFSPHWQTRLDPVATAAEGEIRGGSERVCRAHMVSRQLGPSRVCQRGGFLQWRQKGHQGGRGARIGGAVAGSAGHWA